jgi:ATP-dependent Lon protease
MTDTPRPASLPGDSVFPVLPLRDIVVFPHMIVPLFVGREKSINALEEVMRADKQILLATQNDAGDDDPAPEAIYEVGTLATVLQLLKLPDAPSKSWWRAGIARRSCATPSGRTISSRRPRASEVVGEEVEVEALSRSVVSSSSTM